MVYIEVDLHRKVAQVSAVNETGEQVLSRRVPT